MFSWCFLKYTRSKNDTPICLCMIWSRGDLSQHDTCWKLYHSLALLAPKRYKSQFSNEVLYIHVSLEAAKIFKVFEVHKNLLFQPTPCASVSRRAELAIFFSTSNFDLRYFCSVLAYKNIQHLIWKIWFISIWSQKPNTTTLLFTYFMLAQGTPISYHIEANGCNFFTIGLYYCI